MVENGIKDQIVFLHCSDLQVTSSFYEGLMDFPLVVDQGSCRIVKTASGGGGYLGYCERIGGERASQGVILTMVVNKKEEVDAWYARLLDGGVEIQESPQQNQVYGIYHFFFKDPDGYKLEIQSFEDPDWRDLS
jgi:catechol 2,3-dioxygenase-like lactoylglutathione lyase family enzyme